MPEIKVHAASVVSSSGLGNPNGMVGAPDGSGYDTFNDSNDNVVFALGSFSVVPVGAIISEAYLGARFYYSWFNNGPSLSLTASGYGAGTGPVKPPPTGGWTDKEASISVTGLTAEMLRSGATRLTLNAGSGTGVGAEFYCDAVWARVVYQAAPVVVARAKRWDGSAWQDTTMKRWDGSAWVATTTKRWDGSAWV